MPKGKKIETSQWVVFLDSTYCKKTLIWSTVSVGGDTILTFDYTEKVVGDVKPIDIAKLYVRLAGGDPEDNWVENEDAECGSLSMPQLHSEKHLDCEDDHKQITRCWAVEVPASLEAGDPLEDAMQKFYSDACGEEDEAVDAEEVKKTLLQLLEKYPNANPLSLK
jgi:hypothetical protein